MNDWPQLTIPPTVWDMKLYLSAFTSSAFPLKVELLFENARMSSRTADWVQCVLMLQILLYFLCLCCVDIAVICTVSSLLHASLLCLQRYVLSQSVHFRAVSVTALFGRWFLLSFCFCKHRCFRLCLQKSTLSLRFFMQCWLKCDEYQFPGLVGSVSEEDIKVRTSLIICPRADLLLCSVGVLFHKCNILSDAC